MLCWFWLFTFSRTASILAKSFTGEGAFDPDFNMEVRDLKVEGAAGARPAHLAVRMKGTKTDQKGTRPEAAGNEDWVLIGDAPGTIFSIMFWTQLLFSFHNGARDPTAPFYVDRDRRRPYLYGKALTDIRALWARLVGAALAHECALHGLRVAGYDATRRWNLPLAVAHGGWESQAHRRYERFNVDEVLTLCQRIADQCADGDDCDDDVAAPLLPPLPAAPPVEREVGVNRVPRRLGAARRQQVDPVDRPDGRSEKNTIPPAPSDNGEDIGPVQVSDLTQLTGSKSDVGRRVLVPRCVYPSEPCDEHGGRGWEATVVRAVSGRMSVSFTVARDADGVRYRNAHLSVAVLQPL